MTKIGTLFRSWKILIISFLGMMTIQSASAYITDDPSGEKILLELALHKISLKYDVHFNYDRNIMKDVMVDYEEDHSFSLAETLDHVFEDTHFGYRIFEERYIVVFENNDEGTESLKNMITHMQDLVEERESVKKRTIQPVVGLSTLSIKDLYHKRIVFSVSGTVTDEDGEPLIGVNIQVKGSDKGTSTDFDGHFSLDDIDENAVLVISYVGYQTQEIPLGGESTLAIVMTSDSQLLDEVVVVGYGTQQKKDLTGAVSTISGSDIQNFPVRSAQEALQGKVSGVLISQSSGSPGSLGVVRIRGIGSIHGSNSPLYIVDGLPQNDIGWLNPNTIESVSVLKDASSTAIYGARASNGVILITTKEGKAGEPIRVTFDSYIGTQTPWKRPYSLNAKEFIEYKVRAAETAGSNVLPELSNQDNINQILQFVKSNTGSENGTDWWKEVTNYNAPIQNYNLGITGGSDKTTISSSLAYTKQDGIIKGTNYGRISWNNKFGIEINPKIKVNSDFAIIYEDRQTTGEQNPWTGTVFLSMAVDPITPVFRNDLVDVPEFYNRIMDGYEANNPFSQYSGVLFTNKINPVAQIERLQQNVWQGIGIKGGTSLDIEIIKSLSFRSNFSVDIGRSISKGFTPSYFLNSSDDYSTYNNVSNNSSENNYFVWDNILTYNKNWDFHGLTLMAGTSTELTKGLSFAASIEDIVNNEPDMRIIDAGTRNPGASGYEYSNSLLSFFGRFNYNYSDRYLVTANIRRDGSSNFGTGHRWGIFPSVSLAWRFTEESFMNIGKLKWMDDGKVRVSYGANGNQNVGGGAYLSTYGNTSRYLFGNVNTPFLGAGRTSVGNPGLIWETSNQFDIGIDLSLFKYRLDVVIDYFHKEVKDMLLQLPLPNTFGYPNFPWVNSGSMYNKGIELTLLHRNNIGDFNFEVSGNVSSFKNEVTSLGGGGAIYSTEHLGEVLTATDVGKPVGYYYGFVTDGIFQTQNEVDESPQAGISSPGDIKFKDINGVDDDGNILNGPDGVINSADRTMIGNPWPKLIYGLSINGDYRNFDFGIFFQGSYGNDVLNILRYDLESGTGWYNAPEGFLEKSWDGPGSTNKYYKISENAALNTNVSDYFIEDGSYVRLKNLQIGYRFDSIIDKIEKLRVYVSAQNVFTVTKYSGLDPEIGSSDAKLTGIDQGFYPQPRTLQIGVNVVF